MVLNLSHHLMMLYFCTKFQENISKGFRFVEDAVCILKFSKGHNNVNGVGGVMALVLSTLSDGVYICNKFCRSSS